MKNLFCVLALSLLFACSTKNDNNQDAISNDVKLLEKEQEYLNVRNNFTRYFKKQFESSTNISDEVLKQDSDSLLVLEKMLREILKDSPVKSVVKFGKINLETLIPELGFGNLDGLFFNTKSSRVFVTSKGLFFDYFKSQKITSVHNLSQAQLSTIFTSLISDASATVYYSESSSSDKSSQIYACLGLLGQDIGRFPPDNIFVFVVTEDYIYIVQKNPDKPINEISECMSVYDSMYAISQEQYEQYLASDLTDKKASNKSIELEEAAWRDYCECYQKNFKVTQQYENFKKEVAKIVKYIEQ
ncbi:hypothetical protein [Flavobacterium sp.]|uniref:hypothetical protein n=1 Tax=Flavobacterium sp. TaxID=239 RepID=UPI002605018A|nr:hypothetical protein [Flavobacterium sp.]